MSTEIDKEGKTMESKVAAKPKLDPKDPLRPRRKKARRACFACQRAHLTCGDERPCQRCIKRGLVDTCQDGVRKKAKYLHDVPGEALRPVLGPNYNQVNNSSNNGYSTTSTSTSDTLIEPSSSPFYPNPSANPLLLQARLIQPESFNFDLEGLDSAALGFGMLRDMGTSNGVFGNAGMTATRPCSIFSVPRPSAPSSATQDEAHQALLTLLSFFQFQPGYVNRNKYMIIFKLWQDLTSNQSHDRLLEAPPRIEAPQSDLLASKTEQS